MPVSSVECCSVALASSWSFIRFFGLISCSVNTTLYCITCKQAYFMASHLFCCADYCTCKSCILNGGKIECIFVTNKSLPKLFVLLHVIQVETKVSFVHDHLC